MKNIPYLHCFVDKYLLDMWDIEERIKATRLQIDPEKKRWTIITIIRTRENNFFINKTIIVLENDISIPSMMEWSVNDEHDDNNENVTKTCLDHTKRGEVTPHECHIHIYYRGMWRYHRQVYKWKWNRK